MNQKIYPLPVRAARKIVRVILRLLKRIQNNTSEANVDTFAAAERHRSFDSMSSILSWLLTLTKSEFANFSLEGARALEVGAGKFLVHPMGLHIVGCAEVIATDVERQFVPAAAKLAMSNPVVARRLLSPHVDHDDFTRRLQQLDQTGYDLAALKQLGITYRAPTDLREFASEKSSFDFIYSYTVFEHVRPLEIRDLITDTTALLKPGGVCTHFIDLEDHQNAKSDPFEFLAAQPDERGDWAEFDRGNRLRYSTWLDLLKTQDDMDWRFPYVAIRHDTELPELIDPAIAHIDLDDLRTTAFVAVGKKRE